MTAAIIITICVLLIIAYLFDLSSHVTRIPPVILLLCLGWGFRQILGLFEMTLPSLQPLLPALGTIGLILIVLDGSLELEFDRSKIPMIRRAFFVSLVPLVALGLSIAGLFNYFYDYPFRLALLNAIPFVVISSAIAIPSVKFQQTYTKEFVIYESSLSDILGILFFNFLAVNSTINLGSFAYFGLDLVLMSAISFVAIIGLALLLQRIDHHIKFAPIVILLILIYEIAKIYDLPALLFILLFGLFLGNLDALKRFKWINKLKPDELDREVHKFKDIIIEGTFIIRSVFFILFGFLLQTSEILNTDTLWWSLAIVSLIFIFRAIMLKIAKVPFMPILFIAPRGLITILLFFSIVPEKMIPLVNKSLIVQVIVITALIMMLGLVFCRQPAKQRKLETLDSK